MSVQIRNFGIRSCFQILMSSFWAPLSPVVTPDGMEDWEFDPGQVSVRRVCTQTAGSDPLGRLQDSPELEMGVGMIIWE